MIAPFPAVVGEIQTLTFDFSDELALPWYSEFEYALGEFITVGSFVYECTNAGKTGVEEPPEWSTTIAATIEDGSVEWTCRDFSTSGSDTISDKTVTPSSGLSVGSSTIVKSTRVDVTFTVTATGIQTLLCEIDTTAGDKHKKTLQVVAS